ncbi:MAG: flagellar basal body rod protein FlgB [Candidatus Hinthialibacter antarcticus]|nr:flagellar basal body rod protein FlgB [Candidatus Hinthialibacter antarcticus]
MLISQMFNNTTLHVLKKGIEGASKRHEAISNNIANVDTPKYQRATVDFENQLKRVLRGTDVSGRRTHPAHFIIGGPEAIPLVQPRVDIDNMTRFRPDKNNVNIDQEMADLAENSQRSDQFSELIRRRYQGLRRVLQEAGAR